MHYPLLLAWSLPHNALVSRPPKPGLHWLSSSHLPAKNPRHPMLSFSYIILSYSCTYIPPPPPALPSVISHPTHRRHSNAMVSRGNLQANSPPSVIIVYPLNPFLCIFPWYWQRMFCSEWLNDCDKNISFVFCCRKKEDKMVAGRHFWGKGK